jgi:P-aminobenzoate N-oxygenase AurF
MLLSDHLIVQGAHRSRFRDWDTHSAVRAKPLPSLSDRPTTDKLLFTPELVPAAIHPLVTRRGDRAVRRVLAYHLLGHLDFTDALENEVITPVTYMIGRGQLNLSLPAAMLADARKIAVDEMYHALFATNFMQEIAAASELPASQPRRPCFLRKLDEIKVGHEREMVLLLMLFFAIISETLITATLTRVPKDERVADEVRQVLSDHAEDEARHHAYFADVLALCWPQLKPSQRAIIGPLLPRLIMLFLAPDLDEVQGWLIQIGLSAREVDHVIEQAYCGPNAGASLQSSAHATLRLMKRAGVLDDPRTADSFSESGLLTAPPAPAA